MLTASEIVIKDSSFSSQDKSFHCKRAIRVLLTNFDCFVSGICYNQVLRFPFAHNSRSSTLTLNHFTSASFSSFSFLSGTKHEKKVLELSAFVDNGKLYLLSGWLAARWLPSLINLIIFWDHEFYWCWELFFSVQTC